MTSPTPTSQRALAVAPAATMRGLFKLPAELRNRIYEYALTLLDSLLDSDGGTFFRVVHKKSDSDNKPSALALLRVNRQIHKEARGLFFSLQHPHLPSSDLSCSFFRTISAPRLEGLTQLAVTVYKVESLARCVTEISNDLPKLPKLQLLTIWLSNYVDPLLSDIGLFHARRKDYCQDVLRHFKYLGRPGVKVPKLRLMLDEGAEDTSAEIYEKIMKLEKGINEGLEEQWEKDQSWKVKGWMEAKELAKGGGWMDSDSDSDLDSD